MKYFEMREGVWVSKAVWTFSNKKTKYIFGMTIVSLRYLLLPLLTLLYAPTSLDVNFVMVLHLYICLNTDQGNPLFQIPKL